MSTPDSAEHWIKLRSALPKRDVRLGPASANAYIDDPAMLAFILARYKFAASILAHRERVLEIGCGDAVGAPIVAKCVGELHCTDIDEEQLEDNITRFKAMGGETGVRFGYNDFRRIALPSRPYDGAFAIDVIEHVFPEEEQRWLDNICASLDPHGCLLIGTPNVTASQYASPHSREGHVNLKSAEALRELGVSRFHNVFLFGMNDCVVHTGFPPMCHYLWMLGVGKR